MKWYLVSIQKGNLWAYDNLAVLYIQLKDYENAEKLVKRGLELAKKENNADAKKDLEETLEIIRKEK